MNKQLQEFFCNEILQEHLIFEDFPEYNDLMDQCLPLFPNGDLPKPLFDLIETANLISFAHGLKLGLRLKRWAQSLPL